MSGVKTGWGVAVVLREAVADLACYVGEVQHIDRLGIRLTLMDWMVGECVGNDFWIPWDNVAAMLVRTDKDSGWDPGAFQTRHEEMRTKAKISS